MWSRNRVHDAIGEHASLETAVGTLAHAVLKARSVSTRRLDTMPKRMETSFAYMPEQGRFHEWLAGPYADEGEELLTVTFDDLDRDEFAVTFPVHYLWIETWEAEERERLERCQVHAARMQIETEARLRADAERHQRAEYARLHAMYGGQNAASQ